MKIFFKLKRSLNKIEFLCLKFFLKRYSETQLDQWERWEISSKNGPIYIDISMRDDGYKYNKI